MEFLATPDLGDRSAWHSVTPASAALPVVTPRAHHSPSSQPGSPPSGHSAPASATPQANHAAPFYPHLDRAGIKNSFQSLFSPSPAATPALFRSHGPAPGLTPFINGMATPNLAPPGTNMMPGYPNATEQQRPAMSPDMLSSPYLQAAAKEAVRREFLNMPSYVASKGTPKPAERVVPEKVATPVSQPQSPEGSAQQLVSPSSGDAKVPAPPPIVPLDASDVSSPGKSTTAAQSGELGTADGSPVQQPYSQGMQQQQPSLPSHMHPYFMQAAHHPQQRMLMIGQHGQMMMAGPHPGMYAPPPGMMMFPGGQPQFQRPGMMMQPPHGAPHMVRPPGPPVKPETQEERKKRIEVEKQELIREFKKKTREAALVRFRQKRRERRFGKLIRYDCRKKLADARPRVKGRFVRIKEDDDSDTAQVVPGLDD